MKVKGCYVEENYGVEETINIWVCERCGEECHIFEPSEPSCCPTCETNEGGEEDVK